MANSSVKQTMSRMLFVFFVALISVLLLSSTAAAITLNEAVDAPALTFTTGGHANWFAQTAVTKDGVDAAQSGKITHNQNSWLQTQVTGPGTISFWWRISSENGWDWLEFYINGVRQDRIAGSVGWQQKTYTLGSGANTLQWRYVKDFSVSSGSDSGWIDQVVWKPAASYTLSVKSSNPTSGVNITSSSGHGGTTAYTTTVAQGTNVTLTAPQYVGSGAARKSFSSWTGDVSSTNNTITITMNANRTVTANYANNPESSVTLSNALDAPGLTWSTGGHVNWFGQTAVTKDGVDAAQSGKITHNQNSWLQTQVTGPGTISFWWRVSSENGWDWLEFYVNGVRQNRISGNVGWQQKTYELGSGTHTLQWRYVKDSGVSSGSDSGWVDQVVWSPSSGGTSNRTLTVNSVNPVSGVTIASSSGHGGTTAYSLSVPLGLNVTLTAPQYVGFGSSRKIFSSWSGDVSSTNLTITVSMTENRNVIANYVNDPDNWWQLW